MIDVTPTRSVVLELKDEHRAMHEGYVFLDEKCLLLAGEILRELAHHASVQQRLLAAHAAAMQALQSAVARHGLEGLQVYPRRRLDPALSCTVRGLMGVRLQEGAWRTPPDGAARPAAATLDASPEAEQCRAAFAAVLHAAPELGAVCGNLERLDLEYRRTIRRARALNDILLPEIERDIAEVDTRLEELEQEDAIWMRSGADRS